ncbi:GapR family DNA-binding domain-containing protein [Rhizobium sp. ICMP 5592]|uniref:DUF2312 domain-containing protein n=1 Tax=Rhizobium sp. ICMP 5592 TaxID=2292445 RepID=UPI00129800BE|nr:GapR family DNA-binding domain-containing protein [Rhizobium sp. ICMP 5592]MQB43371.1 DUF2312 domain-containing protein [Rhizobium sp. ICMP 5592]
MSEIGHNSDIENVAAAELRQFIECIERLNDEGKAINEDKAEKFGEMKGRGYDVKAVKRIIRDRAKDTQQRLEEESIYETYKAALGMD